MTTYQSPKSAQHAEGRETQQRQVDSIVRAMRPLTRRVTWKLNPVTGQLVEVR